MLSSSFNGLLILIPGMGRLVGAGPPTAADVAEPPTMNGHSYGGRGEPYKTYELVLCLRRAGPILI